MRTSLVLDKNDVKRAKELEINISKVCRKALLLAIVEEEKKVKV